MKKDGEAEKIIRQSMKQLSTKECDVLIKLYFENKTIYATAKELKITRNTVRYRKEKAKEHLKTTILNNVGNLGITLALRGW